MGCEKGNLCDVLPGRAIGDRFSNREKVYPLHKDANGLKQTLIIAVVIGADRLLYSSDGMIL